jgi:hypothetical protein
VFYITYFLWSMKKCLIQHISGKKSLIETNTIVSFVGLNRFMNLNLLHLLLCASLSAVGGHCMTADHTLFIPSLYWNSDLWIPRNKTARPHSQFLHSCIFEQFIYTPGSVYLFGCSKIGRPILQIYKSLTDQECENWKTEHYYSVLEITRPHSSISGNT